MKRISTLVAIATVLVLGCTKAPAKADDWGDHLNVTAESKDGKLTVTLEGKEGWWVNTAYPGTKVSVDESDAAKVEKATITKDEADFQDPHPGDKAKRAVFSTVTKEKAGVKGGYKTVICSQSTCSPPFKGTFEAAAPAS